MRPVEGPAPPSPLPLSRVTVIRPNAFAAEPEAERWLDEVCRDRELWKALASEVGMQLNRALHAYRTAAGDPYTADVDVSRAIAIRFGYGTGDEVADGRWSRAHELSDRERMKLLRRDFEALWPQERMAAVLGGRETVAPYEELVIRARSDVDAGRLSTAAIGLRAARTAMLADPELVNELDAAEVAARDRLSAATLPEAAGEEQLTAALKAAEALMRRRAIR